MAPQSTPLFPLLLVFALALSATLTLASDFSGQVSVGSGTCCSLTGGNQLSFSSADHEEIVLLGQPSADTSNGIKSGQVTMLTRNLANSFDSTTLLAFDGNSYDFFGQSVAISVGNGVVVAGAPLVDHGGLVDCGAVYVFVNLGSIWSPQGSLYADLGNDNEFYGSAVALSFPYLAVGAPGTNSQQGKVEILKYTNSGFTYLTTLTANNPANSDNFGSVLDLTFISGMWHLVARSGNTVQYFTGNDTFSTFVATVSGASVSLDGFGSSIALSSAGSLAIGAPLYDKGTTSNIGAVFTYTLVNSAWVQDSTTLTPADGAANDNFGSSVAIVQSTLAVGSPYNDASSLADSGAVYVYSKNVTGWFSLAKTVSANAHAGDRFGLGAGASGVFTVGGGWTSTSVFVDGTSFAPVPIFIQPVKTQQTTVGIPLVFSVVVQGGQGTVNVTGVSSRTNIISSNITITGSGTSRTVTLIPTGSGTTTVNLTATDGSQSYVVSLKVRVNTALTLSSIPNVQTYVSNTSFPPLQITVGGGTGSLTLSASSSDSSVYPPNLALFNPTTSPSSPIRSLTLRFPVAFGECNITVTLTDSVGASTTQTFHLSLDLLPTFTSTIPDIGTSLTAASRSFNVSVSGSKPPLVLTVLSSSNPSLLTSSFVVGPGTVAGVRTITFNTPTQTLSSVITLKLQDALGSFTTTTFNAIVNGAPVLVNANILRELYLSDSVAFNVTVINGTAPFTITAVPADNTFITSTTVSGADANRQITLFSSATNNGNVNVAINLVDAAGATTGATTPVTIYIPPSLDVITSKEATALQSLPFTVNVFGTRTPFTLAATASTNTATLPTSGVTFSPVSGASGVRNGNILSTSTPGSATVTITVTDNGGRTSTGLFPVTVNGRPTVVAQYTSLRSFSGEGGNFTVTVGGGTRTLTLAAISSNPAIIPPAGLAVLSQTGASRLVVYNTSGNGAANITLSVTDSVGAVTNLAVPLAVFADMCVPNPCVNGICNRFYGDYNCTCSDTYIGRNCDVEGSKITKELAVIIGASIAGFLLLVFVFFGFYCKWFTKCCCPTTPQYVTNPPPAKMESTNTVA